MSSQELIVFACVLFSVPVFLWAVISGKFDSRRVGAIATIYTVMSLWFIMLTSGVVFFGIFGAPFSSDLPLWAGNMLRSGGSLEVVGVHYLKNIHLYFLTATLFLYWCIWKDLSFPRFQKETHRPRFF